MYNLIEYGNSYSKTSGNLWQYYRDESALNDNGGIIDISDANNNSALFKFKQKLTGYTKNNGTKDAQIMVTLKYQRNFRKAYEMALINCEINLFLTWSANEIIVAGTVVNQVATFAIADTKLMFQL